jgi:very-short-patch-repair endonuclease
MGRIRTLKDNTPRDRARTMRREDTAAEARLWAMLRDRRLGGWRWKRQVPIKPYIVDFLCPEANLIVEADGGQHSDNVAYDQRRTQHLVALGHRVIRFWNSEILTNSDGVAITILDACGGDCPSAPPEGAG